VDRRARIVSDSVSEAALIAETPGPRTRESLAEDLRRAGLRAGDVLILHSSLKAVGWVSGGPVAVLLAFQDVLTETGTLIVPTQTSHLTDPAGWENPPVLQDWVPIIRASVPAFDPLRTPSRDMGAIAETLRTWPGALRSAHPHVSFAAWGRHADHITRDHQLAWSMGEGSPLHRAYSLDARTLLLGTRSCTSLHLAEALSGTVGTTSAAGAVIQDGRRVWATFPDWDYSTDVFPEILEAFCADHQVPEHRIGSASSLLLDQRALVDFAVDFLRRSAQDGAPRRP